MLYTIGTMKVLKPIGRRKVKAKPMIFKFKPKCAAFLRAEAKRSGKTMVRVLEEIMEARAALKTS